jgi:hypothetical protein
VRPWVSIGAFILGILIPVLFFMALLAVLVIVIGGIMYIVSLGDEDRTRTAKRIILYALIGLAVILLAGVLVNFVILLFGGGGVGFGGIGGGGGGIGGGGGGGSSTLVSTRLP